MFCVVNISLKKGLNREICEINCFHVPNHQDFESITEGRKRGRGEGRSWREKQRLRSVDGTGENPRMAGLGGHWGHPSHPCHGQGQLHSPGCSNPSSARTLLMALLSHSQPFWIFQLRNKWEKIKPAEAQWDKGWSWQHGGLPKRILWEERIVPVPSEQTGTSLSSLVLVLLRTPRIPIKPWQHPGGHCWRSPPLPPTLPGEILLQPLVHGHPPSDQLRNHPLGSRTFVNNVVFCSLFSSFGLKDSFCSLCSNV